MPLRTLVIIALRLYAIYWLVEGISEVLIYAPTLLTFTLKVSQVAPEAENLGLYSFIVIPLGMLATAAILWFLSSWISSAVTKGHDINLGVTSLTREDLYRFAFIFLGLWFVLSSISNTMQTGYRFFAFDLPQPDSNPEKGRYFWPFFGHATTLIAGFACVLGAQKWTRKLIRLENKREATTNSFPTA